MNKKRLALIISGIVILITIYSFFGATDEEDILLTTKIVRGTYLNEVIISGEAQSTSSKEINGPIGARRFNIYQLKIQDLVAEGTIVKKGGYIGKIDASEVNSKINDARLSLEGAESRYTLQQLDTTLALKQERTTIKDLLFNIEENQLELKRSIYEPPATIRQLEIKIEKFERELKEKREDYSIKKRQSNAKMIQVGTEVSKIKKQIEELIDLQKEFTVYSEDDGMVTYVKDWNGNKKKVGSTISPWEPAMASLPDLTKMESKTYSNEVDIRKIKKGLKVKIGFDAFPDIEIDGVVTDVANVGENKRGSDIKLFQVLIKLNSTNKNIRPGMTTSNRILTHQEDNVLMAPLEAIFSKDSISYTYVKSGYSIEKRQVELGLANNEVVIIKKGLKENDVVYLNAPENMEEKSIKLLK
ncbi:macrolide transporter subunit MacA [Mariniflexile rhizosphaerae]|uniref:efflux RND transporter periplasmic adaptor subunit n=1 Tax=unclassified Mariniflexile TaxID=2643887 RepID=UPI000CCA2A17|nr:HlyD family secretion protein [Mariniflexile sp. TRM1-10]AXP79125.1 macrolide transporter subunit MacA [Mariniflexile sp. TRM1-10]PLB18697.1 MAG: Secretion protein HlyD [Flavobacteriaceae bacterium FS1-H7996/R]